MKKYYIKPKHYIPPQGKETLTMESTINWSRIIGILSFIATALTFAATFLGQIDPQYSVYALALSAAINAFTGRIQGNSNK